MVPAHPAVARLIPRPGRLWHNAPVSGKEPFMPSFDIVSKTDLAEVDNALQGMVREIGQRFDFKGSHCTIERLENVLTINADDALKLKQMHELLKTYLTRRKLDAGALEFKDPEKATGNSVRQTVTVRQGLASDLAKRIVREIKDAKLKVQVAIQGDELRVTGKKRDDLQTAIQLVRGLKIDQPLQYVNFRD
jgi:cyclic-di-GMP-binding protein